jgi:hypothetical protein
MRYAIPTLVIAAIVVAAARLTPESPTSLQPPMLFQEHFDDAQLESRGWYDWTNPLLSTAVRAATSHRSLEYTFDAGATKPSAGSVLRRKLSPSDSVYLSYYVKYSRNWVGSQQLYHPHEFHFLTTADDDWSGLSNTHLTVYVEQNAGTPLIAIQDGANIDQSRASEDLTRITEHRAVAGCNGSGDAYAGHCYVAGHSWMNEKKWPSPKALFTSTPGPFDKADWHFVEAYIKLNAIAGGRAVNDGVVQYWFDGRPVIEHRDVLLRTAAHPTMQFNQLVIAPYIGDGSPIAQSMWIDDLSVATRRP